MNHTEPQKYVVNWLTCDKEAIDAIRRRFNIPVYTTVNGWSPALIKPEDIELFLETARRGFFGYIRFDWTYNGATYSW